MSVPMSRWMRSRTGRIGTHLVRALLLGAFVLCGSGSSTSVAHADDWLAFFAPCSRGESSRPELTLLYPRPGLPAVVAAGELLIARVRVPAALTPPPGVQQEKVLRAWGADLFGAGLLLGTVSASFEHRYALPAVNLRSDTGASLVYRISLAVPAYAAPGSYDLVLRTPFGALRVNASVRVLARGAVPRIAFANAGELLSAARVATLPVDVWVVPSGPSAAAPPPSAASDAAALRLAETQGVQPFLTADNAGVALRVGNHLVSTRDCPEGPSHASELAALLVAEQRTLLPLMAADQLAAAPPAGAEPSALWLAREAGALAIDNRTAQAAELSLYVPRGFGVVGQGGAFELFPATDVRLRRGSGLVARVHVSAGARAHVSLITPPPHADYVIVPRSAIAGRATLLQVERAEAGVRAAFDLDPTQTAFTGSTLSQIFYAPGAHHVSALVIARDGSAHAARGELWVAPEQPATHCSVRSAGARPGSLVFALLLFAAACLLKRRARVRFGNKLRP